MSIRKNHFPSLIAGTLVCLRRFEEQDAQAMFDAIMPDRDRLLKFLPWPQYINSVEDERDYIRSSRKDFDEFAAFGYGIYPRDGHEFLGTVGSFGLDEEHRCFELGYWLLGAAEGRGYMTESVNLLVAEHQAHGFHRAVIECEPSNPRSRAVAQRSGFIYEGTHRECKWNGNTFLDMQVFAKLL